MDAAAQARRARGRGLGPRGPSPLGAQRPDQRRGGRRPGPAVALGRPAAEAAVSLRPRGAARRGDRRARRPGHGRAPGRSSAGGSRSPTSTRCCSRRRRRRSPSASSWPTPPGSRRSRCPTSRAGRSTCTATPTAPRRKGFWHKERPDHAPDWLGCWDNPDADEGETSAYVVADEPAALVWLANFGALEWHPWTSTHRGAARADVRADRPRPGRADHLGRAAGARPAAPHRARAPRRAWRGAKVTGRRGIQIWVPIGRRLHLRRDPGLGRAALAHGRPGGARAGQLEVGGQGRAGAGPARLHAERRQQDPGRAVLTAAGARAHRSRCRSSGTSSTTPTCGRTAGRSARCWTGWQSRRRPVPRPARRRPGAAGASVDLIRLRVTAS